MKRIVVEDIINKLKNYEEYQAFQVLRAKGVEIHEMIFRGHNKGFVTGIPESCGLYSTVRFGTLHDFHASTYERGDLFYTNRLNIVLKSFFSKGSPEYPSKHIFIYASLADLAYVLFGRVKIQYQAMKDKYHVQRIVDRVMESRKERLLRTVPSNPAILGGKNCAPHFWVGSHRWVAHNTDEWPDECFYNEHRSDLFVYRSGKRFYAPRNAIKHHGLTPEHYFRLLKREHDRERIARGGKDIPRTVMGENWKPGILQEVWIVDSFDDTIGSVFAKEHGKWWDAPYNANDAQVRNMLAAGALDKRTNM